ncbi:MAG TPA: tetratricopeptide repeat protein [Myxococcaceae bacterium]|nr:tetratricopeptide repeat protein [Myxococcaceae bacterium]
MTTFPWLLLIVLAQGQPLPPGHPPVSGGVVPAKPLPPGGDQTLPPNHPPLRDGPDPGATVLPPGHPAIPPAGAAPAEGTGAGPGSLPAGHPSVAPGAQPPTSDELIRRMDATPDLKTKPKPAEVAAAIGKLYYGRARWADARDFFLQAEKTAEPVRALFLAQRKQVKGALPDPASAGCRLSSDMAVDKIVEKAKSLAAQKQPGPAAACAREALGPVLDGTALLGNALALLGDTDGALAAYGRVLQVAPQNAEALYGHGAVTFDVKGDDLGALKTARKELQSAAEIAPSSPQAASAKALAARIDQVIAAGGATKYARQQQKIRAEAKPAVASAAPSGAPMGGPPMAAAPPSGPPADGPGAPPQISKETMEAFQKTQVTPEMEANFARLIDDGEAKLVANKYQDALDDYRQVMPFQPNNARLRAGMAWALVGLQRQPMADRVWQVAVSSDPASVDALGDRLSKAGNRESARALWTKLQTSAPDYASRSGVQKKLGGP